MSLRDLAERHWQGEGDLVHTEHPVAPSSMARNLLLHAAEASRRGKRDLAGDW